MNANMTANGKAPRKQLSDQLDRLDSIIDALSEGLNGAVCDAARDGTKSAVREVLVELLTNPETRGLLRQVVVQDMPTEPVPAAAIPPEPASPPASDRPSWWARAKSAVGQAATTVTGKVKAAVAAVGQAVSTATNFVRRQVTSAARVLGRTRLGRAAVVVVLAVGAAVALGAIRGRAIAAAVTAVVMQTWDRIVRTVSNLRGWTPSLARC